MQTWEVSLNTCSQNKGRPAINPILEIMPCLLSDSEIFVFEYPHLVLTALEPFSML